MIDISYIIRKIDQASIASCSCLTKTPEIEFHSETCRYRILQEIKLDIEKLQK